MEQQPSSLPTEIQQNFVYPAVSHLPVFIGTQNNPENDGIFLYRLNLNNGELLPISSTKAGQKPGYLTLDKHRNFLYAANECEKDPGTVRAFSIDPSDGKLTFLNQQTCSGPPCFVSIDHANKVLLAANYGSGTVDSFLIKEDGSLEPMSDTKKHQGSSVNKDRQEGPHAHFIATDPTNKYALAIDLGLDQIIRYSLDIEKGTLSDPQVAFQAKPGAGPRHLAFHPNERFAYVVHELNSTVAVLAYDGNTGTFKEIETLKTIPEDFKEENLAAGIKLLPNGKVLYATNRGHDSIVVYGLDENTGKLTFIGRVSTAGHWPRDFSVDPTGNFLIVSNERSNNLSVFRIHQETGKLDLIESKIQVSKPTCVQIIKDFC